MTAIEIGDKLFQWRDVTPIPLLLLLLLMSAPSARSATVGTLLLVFGEIIRIYAVSFTGPSTRSRATPIPDVLVAHGPYAIVRNPIYLGNFFLTLGFVCYSGTIFMALIILLAFAFQYYCIVKYEESLLLQKFGDEYLRYQDKVPAWIPSSTLQFEDLPPPESLGEAIKSERRTILAITVVLFLFLLTAH
jgi:protein-S-isoprenylcysteine O-methyltransferase Ste14